MARLPGSSYKRFLQQHIAEINIISTDQDRYYSGPKHFINLEDHIRGLNAPASADQRFDTVRKAFSPQAQQHKQQRLAKHPLQAKDCDGYTNVFNASLESYDQLVELLTQLGKHPPQSSQEQGRLKDELVQTIGTLAHYVGDLHQPLHTTRFHAWPLVYQYRGNSHRFMEARVMHSNDYADWKARRTRQAPIVKPRSKKDVADLLLRQIEAGLLAVYDLVQADQQLRQGKPTSTQYFDRLGTAWKPVIEERMDVGAQHLAVILETAYAEAGQPDFAPLLKPPADSPGQKLLAFA